MSDPRVSFMIPQLYTYLLIFFFVGNSAIFIIVAYLALRPHRAKIFVSYSHKDTEIAKKMMHSLSHYHFRTWIDLGVEIPNDQLEQTLSQDIKERQIFLLLGSKNSVESRWVQFEIERAKERAKFFLGQWRDIVVLALDNEGVSLYETLQKYYDELLLQLYAEEFGKTTPEEIEKLAADLERLKQVGATQPLGRRIFIPLITLIDFRLPFDFAILRLEEYLKLNTKMGRIALNKRDRMKRIFGCFIIYMAFVVLLTGVLLLSRLGWI